jgi:hypothetical protein
MSEPEFDVETQPILVHTPRQLVENPASLGWMVTTDVVPCWRLARD